MRLDAFEITRFQFARDRVIGDSQVRTDEVHVAALELIDENGRSGLGFAQSLFVPLPDQDEIERVFADEVWPALEGQQPLASFIASTGRAAATSGADPAVPRGRAGGAVGPRGQAGGHAAAPAAGQPARPRSGLCLRPRLSPERRRVRRALRPRRRARLQRLQDQGRPSGLRPGPAPAGPAQESCPPRRPDHDRRQRGLGRQGGGRQDSRDHATQATTCSGSRTRSSARLRRACACCAQPSRAR